MCQSVRDGGRRCPIHRHTSHAVVLTALKTTDLNRVQVERLFAELRREGRNAAPLTIQQMNNLNSRLEVHSSGTSAYTEIQNQLTLGFEHDTDMDSATSYAVNVLVERAKERSRALERRFSETSQRTGLTVKQVKKKFNEFLTEGSRERGAEYPPEYTQSTRRRAVLANLPYDVASVVALEKLNNLNDAKKARRVELIEAPETSYLSHYGYDNGRLEVKYRFRDNIIAYKNIPSSIWEKLKTQDDQASMIMLEIRHNAAYQYSSAAEAEQDAYGNKCGSCGQFASANGHTCPPKSIREMMEKSGVSEKRINERISRIKVLSKDDALVEGKITEDLALNYDYIKYVNNGSNSYIDFGESMPRKTGSDKYSYGMNYRTMASHLGDEDGNVTDPAELKILNEIKDISSRIETVLVPLNLFKYAEDLKQQDVQIPVEITSYSSARIGVASRHDITGTILFHVGDSLEESSVKSHRLKCTCEEYQEKYDCKHIRFLISQPTAILQTGSDIDNSDKKESIFNLADRNWNNLRYYREVEKYAEDNNVSFEEADLKVRERTLQREEAEAARYAVYEQQDDEEAEEQAQEVYRNNIETIKKENAPYVALTDEYRNNMLQRWNDVQGERYSETDNNKFYEDYQDALKRKAKGEEPIPFVLNNATDGICAPVEGARRFGVEIEFDFEDNINNYAKLQKIGEELHAAGLISSPEQKEYHSAQETGWGEWSFEEDGTVAGEIVSPIMSDTPEHWEQLRKVCEIVKRHGGVATTNTGSHVHISTGSYGLSTAKHAELIRQTNKHEDVIYRMASNPSRGRHRGTEWCAPNACDKRDDIDESIIDGHRVLGNIRGESHENSMNFSGSSSTDYKKSHVEFRMWDGTLDPAVIQQQVIMSAAITDLAERNVINNKGSIKEKEPRKETGTHKDKEKEVLGDKIHHTPETFREVNQFAAEFIDSIVRTPEQRSNLAALFAVTNWQKSSKTKLFPW